MNSHIWKCSRCNKHTNIDLKGDLININCQCGYQSSMKIKEYINHHKIDFHILLFIMILLNMLLLT